MELKRLIRKLEKDYDYVMPHKRRQAKIVIKYLKELQNIKEDKEKNKWEII
jgi:hypothetical protein